MASSSHPHPFAHPPRLPSPTKGRIHSRRPSGSPARQNARDADPLLRDLSPSSTLRAFLADPSDMDASKSDALIQSIHSASTSERALGAKAAQACLNVRSWVREIESWEWPGTFEVPEPAMKKARMSVSYGAASKSANRKAQVTSAADEEEEYWGSLPAQTVRAYEQRADEISQGLDEIDVEELKDYVLNSHYRIGSRPPSRTDISMNGTYSTPTDLKKLDDFTALVTATILQALPFLSQLNRSLDVWTIRLLILQGAPKYLRDLKRARTDLDRGWTAITTSSFLPGEEVPTEFTRERLAQVRANIEQQIGSLGRRLDRFLDDLEGRSERVPDTWIDDFELLESAYGTWLVQAERLVQENEWRQHKRLSGVVVEPQVDRAKPAAGNGLLTISETEVPSSDDEAVRRASQEVSAKSPRMLSGGLQPLTQPAIAELSDNQEPGSDSRSTSMPIDLDAKPIPVFAVDESAFHKGPQAQAGAAILRSASMSSTASKSEGQAQVAKKRAAFLRDIEQNQALIKSTKTPVRPFEHASNAFTRLFEKMKDKSPEQLRPKRTASKLSEQQTAFAERKALSPVSLASSRYNSISRTNSFTSAASSSKSSVNTPAPNEPVEAKAPNNAGQTHEDSLEEPSNRVYHASGGEQANVLNVLNVSEDTTKNVKDGRSLGSPFGSPHKERFPEDWPLTSPTDTVADQYKPFKDIDRAPFTPPKSPRDSDHELHTPKEPLHTDAFDRMFIETLPPPPEPLPAYKSPSSALHEQRRASLPKRAYLGNVDRPTPTSSPARPKTAPTQTEAQAEKQTHALRRVSGTVGDQFKSLSLQIPGAAENLTLAGAEVGADIFKVKRASVASIETFSRSEVKSIDVPRNSRQSSVSSKRSPSRTPGLSRRSSVTIDASNKRASLDNSALGLNAVSGIADVSPRRSSLQGPALPDLTNTTPVITRSSPLAAQTPASPGSPTAPLNAAMRKLRGQKSVKNENTPPQSSSSPMPSTAKKSAHEDSFDRHVSEVLEKLPAPIRFKSRPGAETPVSRARGYSGPRPKASTVRGPPKAGDMTIAPAETSPRKARSSAEPEVKLYHLTQAGKEDPIKLFVRIVGEGDSERVMARVGGGWADLADYLRDFANHHASRTVSESGLEVQSAISAPGSRKASGTAEYNRAKTPTTPARPGSSDSEQDCNSLKRPPFDAREGSTLNTTTPSHRVPLPTLTPKSTKSSSSSSRPSTAHGSSRPCSRQNGIPSETSLAGPSSASKRSDLEEHKAKWVEGMIEKAKKASSAEKNRETESRDRERYFGELGKVGGTRRVVFRRGEAGK